MKKKCAPEFFILLLVSCLLAGSGCYENQEGCLDTAAVNFDLDADRACVDCCVYPALDMQPFHRQRINDTTFLSFTVDSTFVDALGQPFRVENVRFYLSDFRLRTLTGQEQRVTDTIRLELLPDGATQVFTDDFALLNTALTRDITLGSWPLTGVYDQLSFRFGLDATANRVIPASAPEGHPLNPSTDEFYLGESIGYSFARISILQDTVATDTIPYVFHLSGPADSRELTLPLPFVYASLSGFNTSFNLRVDYTALFAGLNIRADSTVLQQGILANLPDVFSVTDIAATGN